ncbi:efflux RND transporter periplasmic adaptor subunit [Flavobacterium quisquiliarum]|uniref:Efflux RND transporter periplasmic adaptor subunit n=1 Tax=Flavobacterium quisquiliarum TaxID=1834436 RepID=A0ABV8W205_9FLAO|nr:efflux RND transporter periplasmic adaptor subunit [Flavobacterium quisquiliarum]MBW1654567.1 efflux RND transporter periplasmic adaptor subunit [Flavobacterium quisquiliarum]NWL01748.1 efflux RND transporter periplasmic adaptor subunit [Flavobacterium collinsii]
MKKSKLIIIIIGVLLIGCIGYFIFHKEDNKVELITEKPHYGDIATSVTATGKIQPVDTVAVGTQVSGTIQKVFVDFNSVVKKGQLLAQIDQSLFIAQVQQITANLQLAKNNLGYQQSNFNRQSELYKAGGISRADFETAKNLYDVAKDNVNSVTAQLSSAKKNLSFTNIFSPIDGTVLSRKVSEGQTVAASLNTPTLFSIARDLTKMQVQASVDEADVGNVKAGETATFTVDAFPDDVFKGTVIEVRLQPAISSNVVTYTTIINAPNVDLKLKPGMTANIIIYTNEVKKTLLISAKAIAFQPDSTLGKQYKIRKLFLGNRKGKNKNKHEGNSKSNNKSPDTIDHKKAIVWKKEGDSIIPKHIRIGLDDDINVQVVEGIKEKDEIITGVNALNQSKESKGTNSSPFMPKRGGGGGKR